MTRLTARTPVATGAIVTRFSEIASRPVDWLWRGYIPAGMLTVLDGDPGLGKSTLTDDLAARVSTGRAMPDGAAGGSPAGVVLLSAEDDLARTIRPRLEAAGADLERVATIELPHPDGGRRPPDVTRGDLERIEAAIRAIGAGLLVLDPLVAYLPDGINPNHDHAVRRVLTVLSDFAGRTGCAVIVVRHLRKSEAENPLYRGGGSIGITAAARAVFLVAPDPDDPSGERRVFAPLKTNLGPMPSSLAFRLLADPSRDHAHIAWDGVSAHDARSLLAVRGTRGRRTATDEAEDVLRDLLEAGPRPAGEAQRLASEAGVADRTLDRARRRLGVTARKVGKPGEAGQHWAWSLPPKDANALRRTPGSEIGVLQLHLAPFDRSGDLASVDADPVPVELDYPAAACDIGEVAHA